MTRRAGPDDDKLGRDDRVKMPLDPEVAIRALIEVGEPEPDPRREAERERQAEESKPEGS